MLSINRQKDQDRSNGITVRYWVIGGAGRERQRAEEHSSKPDKRHWTWF